MLDTRNQIQRSLTGQIAMAILLGMVFAAPASASGNYSRMRHDMKALRDAAILYRVDHDQYPTSDSDSSWFEKLAAGNYCSIDSSRWKNSDSGEPLDLFRQPYVYELPAGAHGDPENLSTWPIIRSIGANGVDDNGAGDDWDIRYGPNWGYWYKRHWTRGVVAGCLSVIGVLFFMLISGRMVWLIRLGFALIMSGLGTYVSGYAADPYFDSTAGMLPFGHLLAFTSFLCDFILGVPLVALGGLIFAIRLRKQRLVYLSGRCSKCRYDLEGNVSGVCPECGAAVQQSEAAEYAYNASAGDGDRSHDCFTHYGGPPV